MQRYASSATPEELEHCAWLLESAPNEEARRQLMIGMNRAFQGRSLPPLPASLAAALDEYQSSLGDSGIILGLRQSKPEAIQQAIQLLTNRSSELGLQIEIAKVLGEVNVPQTVADTHESGNRSGDR